MISLFRKKDPVKLLNRQYLEAMRVARDIQRSGDIVAYADKIAEAERIRLRIEELEATALDNDRAHDRT